MMEHLKSDETRQVEDYFRLGGYTDVEAYRYNPASIRVRVRDEQFRDLFISERFEILDPVFDTMPDELNQELIFVLPFALGEEHDGLFEQRNREFESGTVIP